MKRFLWLGFVLCIYVICTGCGDTFRQIIIPNPPTFPNPAAAHSVLTIGNNENESNGSFVAVPGSAMVINVSGDSVVSQANMGLAPVYAVQQSASQVLVLNQAYTGSSSSCVNNSNDVCPSLTKIVFGSTTISNTTTISLPANSAPNVVATTESTEAYVLMPSYIPDPVNSPTVTVPTIAVVNTNSNGITATITVGNNPVAMAETPNGQKLYVANEGDGTISAFNTVDRSTRPIGGTLSSPPIWLSARSDSQVVYVLEANGTLAYLDTSSTAGPDTLTETTSPPIKVPGAAMMTYDFNFNRLYIAGGQQMVMADVSQSPPQIIDTFAMPNIPGLPSVLAYAVSVAALPDGSQAYVATVPSGPQPSEVNISAVQGDGTNATYTYTLTGGHDLTPGITVAVSGIAPPNDDFNGTFAITAVAGTSCAQVTQACTFVVTNSTQLAQTAVTASASSTIDNIFPQVVAVNTVSNAIKTTIGIPGFPDATNPANVLYYAPICATTRFRFLMAAGGDSSRAYLSACDGGNINFIQTSNDTYLLNQALPAGARAPIPPSTQNPPQNPVFLLAGP
jgi:DNA-binding beta-propeller fold protein YncE